MTDIDPQPELDEVLQEPTAPASIVVTPSGPVGVVELPAQHTTLRSISVTAAETVAGADPRRARLTLISKDKPIYVGSTRQAVTDGSGVWWPSGVPLTLRSAGRIWVASADVAQAATVVSVISESRAD